MIESYSQEFDEIIGFTDFDLIIENDKEIDRLTGEKSYEEIVEENNHFYSTGIATKYLYFISMVYIVLWIVLMVKNIINLKNINNLFDEIFYYIEEK